MHECFIYRYIDRETLDVKYIGITHSGRKGLIGRLTAHKHEQGFKADDYIDIMQVPNQAYAEALEGHFIGLYEPTLNTSKKEWSCIGELHRVIYKWKECPGNVNELATVNFDELKRSKYASETTRQKAAQRKHNKRIADNIGKMGLIKPLKRSKHK